jgi:hypothetical protein
MGLAASLAVAGAMGYLLLQVLFRAIAAQSTRAISGEE